MTAAAKPTTSRTGSRGHSAAQVVDEEALVAESGDEFAVAKSRNMLYDAVSPHRQVSVPAEEIEDQSRGLAHGRPGVGGIGREELCDVFEEGLVIGEDHVFLGAELPEERPTRHTGGSGDLLDGGGFVPVLREQPDRLRRDVYPKLCGVSSGYIGALGHGCKYPGFVGVSCRRVAGT